MPDLTLAPGRRERLLGISPTALATLAAALLLLGWDFAGLDLALARWFGNSQGFPLRENWFLANVMHEGGRKLSWAVALALCVAVKWPLGPLRQLSRSQRLYLAVTTLAAALVVSLLKGVSPASCPWDLKEFGGVARYLHHWQLAPDGGPGHCFPAGHAASGFSFLAGYFAFRDTNKTVAWVWLAAALTMGLVFGWGQQVRGAHFLSHNLWTGWLCWCVAWAMHAVWRPAPMAKD